MSGLNSAGDSVPSGAESASDFEDPYNYNAQNTRTRGHTSPTMHDRTQRLRRRPDNIGGQGESTGGRQGKLVALELIPNSRVDALRIADRRREEIDDEKMDAMLKEIDGLFDEGPESGAAALVAG